MANTDIRLMISFKEHRKRKKLNYIMDREKSGTDYLIDLWISAANDRPDGVLTGWDEVDIALACGWDGEPQQIVDYLIQSGWLDCAEDGTCSLHDWEEYQGWVMGAKRRSENARKAALAKHGCTEHAESTRGACGAQEDCDADSTAPSPSPSPLPSPKPTSRSRQFSPPSENDVVCYFVENGYSASAGRKAFRYYEDGDPPWHDSNGKKVKSWKQKMRGVWFKPENESKEKTTPDWL